MSVLVPLSFDSMVTSVAEEREAFVAVQCLLAPQALEDPQPSVRLVRDGVEVEVPPGLAAILWKAAASLAQGDGVTVLPVSPELSTTEAARMLRISRPTLIKACDAGDLPSRKVGTHRRIATRDVVAYQAKLREKRLAAYEDLVEYTDDLGLVEG